MIGLNTLTEVVIHEGILPMPTTKVLDRAKLKKMVKDSQPGEFRPTITEVVFWYDNLNEHIFENKLPSLGGINFLKTKDYWGEITCQRYKYDGLFKAELKLSYDFLSFKDFVEVIAHEMVHVWEYTNFSVMGHGDRFFSWEPKLKALGLRLQAAQ